MFIGNAEAVAREQHKDNLRRIEKANLIKQIERKDNRPGVWQTVRNWLKPGATNRRATVRGEANLA